MPTHRILDTSDVPAESRKKLQDSLVLVHGGMAQNVGPILEMVTEKYLLRSGPEWIARQLGHTNTQMLFRVYSRYVPNLTRQDGSAMERLLATSFAGGDADSGGGHGGSSSSGMGAAKCYHGGGVGLRDAGRRAAAA